ncbi:hypothetical protein BC831DRAFT_481974 [Entophlyctis helioformis]|nr:hypothetical protein BC831DRAFT_481974 [Entophlyctis helioformis]
MVSRDAIAGVGGNGSGGSSNSSNSDSERKRFFGQAKNRQRAVLASEAVYQFEAFNPFLQANELRIGIPGLTFDVRSIVGEQPMVLSVRSRDGSCVCFVVELRMVEC